MKRIDLKKLIKECIEEIQTECGNCGCGSDEGHGTEDRPIDEIVTNYPKAEVDNIKVPLIKQIIMSILDVVDSNNVSINQITAGVDSEKEIRYLVSTDTGKKILVRLPVLGGKPSGKAVIVVDGKPVTLDKLSSVLR